MFRRKKEPSEAERLRGQEFVDRMVNDSVDHILSIPRREREKRTRKLLKNDLVVQRLAKRLVLVVFRNPLEDIHTGKWPSSFTGDYSDVKVVSPYGEIPWTRLSRISDEEMKDLNIQAVNAMYAELKSLFLGYSWPRLEYLEKADILPHWNPPEDAEISPPAPLVDKRKRNPKTKRK